MKYLLPYRWLLPATIVCCLLATLCSAQGTWTPVATPAPDYNNGVMMLLTDGSVIVKTSAGGVNNTGTQWDRLYPDSHGSYAKGTYACSRPNL